MALKVVKLGQVVTVGTTADEIKIDETYAGMMKPCQELTVRTITGNTGTIKFAVGETPPAGNEAVAASQTFVIHGIKPGFRNLWAVGSLAGQQFVIY